MRIWICLFGILSAAVCAETVNPQVTLQISGGVSGTIVLELYPDQAPVTVANFINYVQSGFYNGLIFHRVMPGFMIQGGGFTPTLVQKATGPVILNESSNRLSNLRGTVAMARTVYADSATSQFYINLVDNPFLDYGAIAYQQFTQVGYCVFGKVVSGLNVVDAIAAVTTETVSTPQGNLTDVPVQDVIIQSATVSRAAPVCARRPAGDVDGDCRVGLSDLALLAQHWMACDSITPTCD